MVAILMFLGLVSIFGFGSNPPAAKRSEHMSEQEQEAWIKAHSHGY